MKIFVGFGYNDRDSWIPELVFPLIRAFDAEVVTGEDLAGQQITDEIRRRIDASDALIGFRTRRGDPDARGVYPTHRWVDQELAYASAMPRVLEVREDGIDEQGGLGADRQWLVYREADRDRLLVELAKAVGGWSRGADVRLQLLPPEFVEEIRPLLRVPGFRCTYTLLEGSRESTPQPVQIRPIKGGLFIQATGLNPQTLIQVCVEGDGKRWCSDYEPLDSVAIRLNRE